MERGNNFDLLRFALAFTVFLVHAHVLTEHPDLRPLSAWLSSEVAVRGFFVVSGYLVLMSYEHTARLGDYFGKRCRRIYPAYATVVLLCGLLGAGVTALTLPEYFSRDLARYLAANLVFLNFLAPSLPGVFSGNALNAVNGALWTLKIEVMFYVCIPLIAWLIRRLGRATVFAAIYALSLSYSALMLRQFEVTGNPLYEMLARQLPGQMTYFVVGMACYSYRRELSARMHGLLAGAVVLYALHQAGVPYTATLEPLALGTMMIYFATTLRHLGNFGRHGDLSYGVYIIHFPVLQTLIASGWFRENAAGALVAAAAIILAGALLSWHLVEKRWLRKSSHYVVASSGAAPAPRP